MAADPDLQVRLGRRCRAVRQRRKLSLMDVVKNHDLSLSHLQKIERGALDPRLSTLKKLADAYGVTLSTLLKDV
ncbi:MAG: helix-turn-helix transcriptional regulator [Sandaracinaceae bacterium]|nr:helix-turn-helix transcriptional regulator [Sandaracinaceae bacterium]